MRLRKNSDFSTAEALDKFKKRSLKMYHRGIFKDHIMHSQIKDIWPEEQG